jgi:hypothetical protein
MIERKKQFLVTLVLAAFLSYGACAAGNGGTGGASRAQVNQVSKERTNGMKVRIKIGEKEVTATLKDSETARDFASLLPLTLTLEDYAHTEKISDLPKRLSTDGAPSGSDPDVGDIAYYAPWGNLAIYYKDFGYSNGLIILGKIDSGPEAFDMPGSVKATIELVK